MPYYVRAHPLMFFPSTAKREKTAPQVDFSPVLGIFSICEKPTNVFRGSSFGGDAWVFGFGNCSVPHETMDFPYLIHFHEQLPPLCRQVQVAILSW